jgi:hypothetical protein
MDQAKRLKALALAAKSDEKMRKAKDAAAAKRISRDKTSLEKQVLTAALAGASSVKFVSHEVMAAWYFRDMGFRVLIDSRSDSQVSGEIAWKYNENGDVSLSDFGFNFIGWLTTSEGKHFSQRLFGSLENAATLGRSGAKFSIEMVSDGFLIAGKTKSPAPELVGKILKQQGFRYDLIDLLDERVEIRVYWL